MNTELIKSNCKLADYPIQELSQVVLSQDTLSFDLDMTQPYLITNVTLAQLAPLDLLSPLVRLSSHDTSFQPVLLHRLFPSPESPLRLQCVCYGSALRLRLRIPPNSDSCLSSLVSKVTVYGYCLDQSPMQNQVVPLLNLANQCHKTYQYSRNFQSVKLRVDLVLFYAMINARRFV